MTGNEIGNFLLFLDIRRHTGEIRFDQLYCIVTVLVFSGVDLASSARSFTSWSALSFPCNPA